MSLKTLKRNFLVSVATKLFMENGITKVTVKDIAQAAEVGEATIYRYFAKKQNIVLASILSLQTEVQEKYFNLVKGNTGFEMLEIFYNSYLNVFKEKIEYFYFIKEFDSYLSNDEDFPTEEYEKELANFQTQYMEAYELGLEDGSIKKLSNPTVFYFSTTHAMLELCKKLSMKQALLTQDKSSRKIKEIECLIEVILNSVKNCESNAK